MKLRVVIVGGGIVGLATAHQLLCRFPSLQVLVLEKDKQAGSQQTGHNSGVLHSGLYYSPGSLKARLSVEGIRRMTAFCDLHHVPYRICGKIVLATDKEEMPRLHALYQRGLANGLTDLQMLGPEEIREREPHAAGVAAVYVPQEGIVDFHKVAQALVQEITLRGGVVRCSSRVERLKQSVRWQIISETGEDEADFLINCAGLHSDRVSRLAGNHDRTQIVPFRGEYYRLRPERDYLVRNLIYPVPDPKFPFLGVHFTRQIDGCVEAGPNAVLAFAREGYRYADINLKDLIESLTYGGFWRFLLRYPSICWDEFYRSCRKEVFCHSLQRLVPEIQVDDLGPGGAGVRAQALSPSGELLQDFYFIRQPHALHVVNAPSPAATASLAIADEIIDRMKDAFNP